MRTISVFNQKGGSAKTTTAVNLAAGLARVVGGNKRVLAIDIDPQAALTALLLGIRASKGPQERPMIRQVLLEDIPPQGVIQTVQLHRAELQWNGNPNPLVVPKAELDFLPSHINLAPAEMLLVAEFQREQRLAEKLVTLVERYEYVVIDCPPSLGLLTINALMAAGEVIVPVDPGYFPLAGISLVEDTIARVRKANKTLHILGVLPTLADNTVLSSDTQATLRKNFGDLVFAPIPRRVAVGEAHAQRKDIFAYAPTNDAAVAYARLVREVIRRG
jgi:chromosome partitioning protein